MYNSLKLDAIICKLAGIYKHFKMLLGHRGYLNDSKDSNPFDSIESIYIYYSKFNDVLGKAAIFTNHVCLLFQTASNWWNHKFGLKFVSYRTNLFKGCRLS